MAALSVLIPVRNAEATLDQALDSIEAQTFTDWEGILVDDGSTDATPGLLEARCRREHRWAILRNERTLGLVTSLNRGLEAVSAPVVARMDADDISLPERFARQMERLGEGDVAAVGCRVRYFPDHGVADGARRYEAWLNSLVTPEEHERDVFVECPLAHPSMMLRVEAVRAVGGYRAHGWAEDYDLCLRLWASGYRFAKVPEPLFLWRESPHRASRTQPEYTPEAFYRCKAHYLCCTHLAGGRPGAIFGAGPVGKAMARALLAEGAPLTALVDVDPRRIGQRICGLPVLPREEGLRLKGQAYGLAAVGRPEARADLRAFLLAAGWDEGDEFRCVA
jgi:GT2 family glycosyltransferase